MKRKDPLKFLILISQGGLFFITLLLYYIFRRTYFVSDLWDGSFSLPLIIYTGIMAGFCVRIFGTVLGESWPRFQKSMDETVNAGFKGITNEHLFLISLPPAIVEELFFRGFLQPTVGIIFTSVIFSLLHWGLQRKLWAYGLYAFIISLFFGWLYLTTGSLLTTMIAHLTNNFLAGLYIQDRIPL